MNDLISKLEAAIAETERIARDASPAPWSGTNPGPPDYHDEIIYDANDEVVADQAGWGGILEQDTRHIVLNDPARVLRRVARDRKLLELHYEIYRDIGWLEDGAETQDELPVCGHCVPRHSWFKTRAEVPIYPCATVQLVAEDYGIEVES